MNDGFLITGARIEGGAATDLLLRDGRIAQIGVGLAHAGAEVVDAEGLVALPGLVDLHTHLREPGREDAETVESGCRHGRGRRAGVAVGARGRAV